MSITEKQKISFVLLTTTLNISLDLQRNEIRQVWSFNFIHQLCVFAVIFSSTDFHFVISDEIYH